MIQTPNLGLEKYELTDAANLADGYNNSMDTLDKFAGDTNAHFPIKTSDIADGAVINTKISNGAVDENKLATASVTNTKIATDSVTADKIPDGEIVNRHIGDLQITNDKIANNTISNNKLIYTRHSLLVFGDSFSAQSSYYSPSETYWCVTLANALGLTLHNYAINGAGIYSGQPSTPENGRTLSAQVSNAIADNSYIHNDVDYIYIFMGINDFNTTTVNINIMADTLIAQANRLHSEYPNAKIIYIPNMSLVWLTENSITYAYVSVHHLLDRDNALFNALEAKYCNFAIGRHPNSVLLDTIRGLYNPDTSHPTELWQKKMAQYMISLVNGSHYMKYLDDISGNADFGSWNVLYEFSPFIIDDTLFFRGQIRNIITGDEAIATVNTSTLQTTCQAFINDTATASTDTGAFHSVYDIPDLTQINQRARRVTITRAINGLLILYWTIVDQPKSSGGFPIDLFKN